MRGLGFLRFMILGVALAGCGSDPPASFSPDDAAADAEKGVDASDDMDPGPMFDVPDNDVAQPPDVTQADRSMPGDTATDRSSTTDSASTDRPVSTDRPSTTDTGTSGMCPTACAINSDCNPCLMPGDTGNYCCISGLCVYATDMCSAAPDGGMMGTPDGGGGGADGGADGGGGLGDIGGFGDGSGG